MCSGFDNAPTLPARSLRAGYWYLSHKSPLTYVLYTCIFTLKCTPQLITETNQWRCHECLFCCQLFCCLMCPQVTVFTYDKRNIHCLCPCCVKHLSMRNALRFTSNSLGKEEIRLSYTRNAPIKSVVFQLPALIFPLSTSLCVENQTEGCSAAPLARCKEGKGGIGACPNQRCFCMEIMALN